MQASWRTSSFNSLRLMFHSCCLPTRGPLSTTATLQEKSHRRMSYRPEHFIRPPILKELDSWGSVSPDRVGSISRRTLARAAAVRMPEIYRVCHRTSPHQSAAVLAAPASPHGQILAEVLSPAHMPLRTPSNAAMLICTLVNRPCFVHMSALPCGAHPLYHHIR